MVLHQNNPIYRIFLALFQASPQSTIGVSNIKYSYERVTVPSALLPPVGYNIFSVAYIPKQLKRNKIVIINDI
jgi:hypothetical protein